MKLAFATGLNGEFSNNGKLPWGKTIKNDMNHFIEFVKDHKLIMGYKTWMSLPEKTKEKYKECSVVLCTRPCELDVEIEYVTTDEALESLLQRYRGSQSVLIGGAKYIGFALDNMRYFDSILHTVVFGKFECTQRIDVDKLDQFFYSEYHLYDDCEVCIY